MTLETENILLLLLWCFNYLPQSTNSERYWWQSSSSFTCEWNLVSVSRKDAEKSSYIILWLSYFKCVGKIGGCTMVHTYMKNIIIRLKCFSDIDSTPGGTVWIFTAVLSPSCPLLSLLHPPILAYYVQTMSSIKLEAGNLYCNSAREPSHCQNLVKIGHDRQTHSSQYSAPLPGWRNWEITLAARLVEMFYCASFCFEDFTSNRLTSTKCLILHIHSEDHHWMQQERCQA